MRIDFNAQQWMIDLLFGEFYQHVRDFWVTKRYKVHALRNQQIFISKFVCYNTVLLLTCCYLNG